GLAPAIRATRTEPGTVMKSGGRGMTASRGRFSLRRALVVAQVAMSLVLVAGALLFSRSLGKLLTVDAGFRQEEILTAKVNFRQLNLPTGRYHAFKDDLLERIRAIPGAESVALTHIIPLNDWGGGSAWIDGTDASQAQNTSLSRVGPNYFNTLQIPMLAGRDFDARDRVDATKAAIVNET